MQAINRNGRGTQDRELIQKSLIAYSTPLLRRNPGGWDWAWPFAVRSLNVMKANCWLRRYIHTGRYFELCCRI